MSYALGMEYHMELFLGRWKLTIYPEPYFNCHPTSVIMKHNETTESAINRAIELAKQINKKTLPT